MLKLKEIFIIVPLVAFLGCGGSDSTSKDIDQQKVMEDKDNENLSLELGISSDEVSNGRSFIDNFYEYAETVRLEYPNKISAVYADPLPDAKGHIKFVETIPQKVTDEVMALGFEDNYILTANGGISEQEHQDRVNLVVKSLREMNYTNFITFFDVINYKINIELRVSTTEDKPTKEYLLSFINTEIDKSDLEGRASIVEMDDIKWTIDVSDEPLVSWD